MLQPKEKPKYPIYFYQHQYKKVLILDEVANMIIKDKKIVGWMVTIEEQIKKLNLGSEGDPKEVLINAVLPTSFQAKTKNYWLVIVMFLLGIIKILREYLRKFVNKKLIGG
jgi:hypothetical protein